MAKRVQAYNLPVELVERIRIYRLRSELRNTLAIDNRGLVPADYDELRRITGSSLNGDDLIDFGYLKSPAGSAVERYVKQAIRRNRRQVTPTASTSSVVEYLITKGLETANDAAIESAAGKSRRTSKVA